MEQTTYKPHSGNDFLADVCALQEHERTRTQFTQKNSKILIKICVTSERENKFPEGESPLYARPQTGLKY